MIISRSTECGLGLPYKTAALQTGLELRRTKHKQALASEFQTLELAGLLQLKRLFKEFLRLGSVLPTDHVFLGIYSHLLVSLSVNCASLGSTGLRLQQIPRQ